MPLSRRSLLAVGPALALAAARSAPARAYVLAELYRGRTIVTGRRPETRIPGMVRALSQVLVRVSGDARVAANPGLARLQETPEAAVVDYTYRDLYAFRPIRDEQGTRDRPYEMTVRYDPPKIDAMLAGLGSRPWLGPRPRLVIFLAVRHIGSSFMLSSTGDAGELMRQSFQDAAWNAAMEVAVATPGAIAEAGLTVDSTATAPLAALARLTDTGRGEVPLVGMLEWDRHLLAWRSRWRFLAEGGERRWQVAGVNFDAAFRTGVGGAAQILSGNGTPG